MWEIDNVGTGGLNEFQRRQTSADYSNFRTSQEYSNFFCLSFADILDSLEPDRP
jgi:hypothetical protein